MKLSGIGPARGGGLNAWRIDRWLWIGGLAAALACAASRPTAYERSRAAAERAYVHGRYQDAAAYWLEAAQKADRQRDRNEAHYRAAASLRRAGSHAEAARLYRSIARTAGHERAARAALDLANLELAQGNENQGYALLDRALRAHPDSGLAPGALRRYLGWLEQREGASSVLGYLDDALAALDRSELSEHLHYAYARALSARGMVRAARDRYLYLAKRFPYPHGALWDDSLWHASHLEEKLGDYRAAIRHLRRMLAEREPPSAPGTYNRPRYDESQFRIAELYRDRLGDARAAQREFQRVFVEHPDSLLRDDALWNAALAAHQAGDPDSACKALKPLVEDLPDSRFAPCAKEICPRLRAADGRPCRAYIKRQLEQTEK